MSSNHPRLNNLRSTAQVLREATASFKSHLSTFIFLSLLILSFRLVVENGSHFLTTFIDHDPSLKALFSRIDLTGNRHHAHSSAVAVINRRQRRRPFLHITRFGTLDEDFFAGDGDDDPSVFGSTRKSPSNSSFVIFDQFDSILGISVPVNDNGIRVSEIVHPGITFKVESPSLAGHNDSVNDEGEETKALGSELGDQDSNRVVDFRFFVKGLELGRGDVGTLFFLVSFLSAVYGWVILGFVVTYSLVLGTVFIAVVNDLIGRFSSFAGTVWDGSRLGLKRLSGFFLLRWALRDALTQLLGLWFFGEIEDKYSVFQLFVRLKLVPFSIVTPWLQGFEKQISGFLVTWLLLDMLLSFIFAVDAWVVIADSRRSVREIVKEGCYLISTLSHQAIEIKCLETILCGSIVRLVLSRVCGRSVVIVLQSVMEVYFMVVWLIVYFAAKCKDVNSQGRIFGPRELEGLIGRVR